MIIQMCGLSGAGKSTLAQGVKAKLMETIDVEVIDGDEYRRNISPELGFSKEDRIENIRRLGFIANKFSQHKIIPIICAINPYNSIREEIRSKYTNVKTVYIKCELDVLFERDTKGLYSRTKLHADDPNKLSNLTGVNDPFELPEADLIVDTSNREIEDCINEISDFIKRNNN